MLEPPSRERWLEAVGPALLDGAIADGCGDSLEASPGPVRDPGPHRTTRRTGRSGHLLRQPLPRPGRSGRATGRLGLCPRRDGGGHAGAGGARAGAAGGARGAGAGLRRPRLRARAGGRGGGVRFLCDLRRRSGPHGGSRRQRPASRLAPVGAGGQGHAAARRPARLPSLARRTGLARRDRHRLLAGRSLGRRRRRSRRPPPAPGSRLPARLRSTTPSHRPASTCCRCSASASRPTWMLQRPRMPRSPASPRPAPACRTGSSTGSRSAPASSRTASASRAATSSMARCCPASSSRRIDRRRFGIDGLYLAGSGAHPGGAVTGAPGYLAARAVVENWGHGPGRPAGRLRSTPRSSAPSLPPTSRARRSGRRRARRRGARAGRRGSPARGRDDQRRDRPQGQVDPPLRVRPRPTASAASS